MNKSIVLCCLLFVGTVQTSDDHDCERSKTKDLKPTHSDTLFLGPGSGGTGGDDQRCDPTIVRSKTF